jgi:hypothetical protein
LSNNRPSDIAAPDPLWDGLDEVPKTPHRTPSNRADRDLINPLLTLDQLSAYGRKLKITCRKCDRQNIFEVTTLAKKIGPEKQLSSLYQRLTCTKCGAKDIKAAFVT